MTEKKIITLRLPNEATKGLKNISEKLGISVNTLVVIACLESIKKEKLHNVQRFSDKHR